MARIILRVCALMLIFGVFATLSFGQYARNLKDLQAGMPINTAGGSPGAAGSPGATGSPGPAGTPIPPAVLASLATCDAGHEGWYATETNSTAACSVGATATDAGTTHCALYCNGTNWVQTGL
jgi:hypothetical protein